MRICIATSTRADWGILSSLAGALRADPRFELQILATNMHLSDEYGHTADEIEAAGFRIDAGVRMDIAGEGGCARAAAMGECLQGCAKELERLSPDAIVILGDRFEMLAVASAAALMLIPIIHISGGETTGGAVDDSIRHAITQLASLHLVSAEPYREKVIAMGKDGDKVINTGSLGVWNMINRPFMSRSELCENIGIDPNRPFAVATFHAATLDKSGSPGERCRAMLDALDNFPDIQLVVTYPNNDTGSEEIIKEIEARGASQPGRIKVIKSLGLTRYMSAIREAEFVIGNSSSGIIEVPSTGTPVINIGIRQLGRLHGEGVIDCGDEQGEITEAIREAMSPQFKEKAATADNPYYAADTLARSVEAIADFVSTLK